MKKFKMANKKKEVTIPTPVAKAEVVTPQPCVVFTHPGISEDIYNSENPEIRFPIVNKTYVIEKEDGEYVMNYADIPSFVDVPMHTAILKAAGNDENPSDDCIVYSHVPEMFNEHVKRARHDQFEYLAIKYNNSIEHLTNQCGKVCIDKVIEIIANIIGRELTNKVIGDLNSKNLYHSRCFYPANIRDVLYKAYLNKGAIDIARSQIATCDILSADASVFVARRYDDINAFVSAVLYERLNGYIDITQADKIYAEFLDFSKEVYTNLGSKIFELCESMAIESHYVYLSTYPQHEIPRKLTYAEDFMNLPEVDEF